MDKKGEVKRDFEHHNTTDDEGGLQISLKNDFPF